MTGATTPTTAEGLEDDEDALADLVEQSELDERDARVFMLVAARHCAWRFTEHVLRDERNGHRIKLAPMHREWHELIDKHDRLIIWSHVEAGKTQQIPIGRALFELGRNRNLRIVVLAKTQNMAGKIVRSCARYIDRSQELRDVFPDLIPSIPWTSTSLTVERDVFSKDPSIQALGYHGAVVGTRIDLLFIDDILDWANTRTPYKREELAKWFASEILGRLTDNSRVVICGNAYHPDDLLHELERLGYAAFVYAIRDALGQIRFPELWNDERIENKRKELGPTESARQLDCVSRKEEDQRCKQEWIDACLERGRDVTFPESITSADVPAGAVVFTGVDIGVKKKQTSAKTVVFSALCFPDGDRRLLRLRSGRWSAVEIIRHVLKDQRDFDSVVLVEDNGAQHFLVELAQGRARAEGDAVGAHNIRPFTTGANKNHPVFGVEGVFAEFHSAKWIIPSRVDERGVLRPATKPIAEWVSECVTYDPERHTGDHLMASWFVKEGGRQIQKPVGEAGGGGVRIISADAAPLVMTEEMRKDREGWEAIMPKRKQ